MSELAGEPMSTTPAPRRGRLLAVGAVVLLAAGGGALAGRALDGGEETTPEPAAAEGTPLTARSVIFVNGDGMAATHREAARLDQQGFDGRLAMDSLPVAGLQSTEPHDPTETVTDSAAGASAWTIGEKTYNGAISVDADGNPLPTLGAEAAAAGRATGLVTTAQVTDATPAAFFSSSPNRSEQADIASQYLADTEPSVILGGGEDWWLPAGSPGAYPDAPAHDPDEGSRGTSGDLIAQAQQQGYEYVRNGAELAASDGDKLLGLFANQEMFQQRPEGEGDEFDPAVPLADMTSKALDVLSRDDDGFLLVIEEEAVDEMSHANNGVRMLEAMRSLDAAVAVARDYVAEHPDTLLVVTGDHECGGLTIEDVDAADESGPGGTSPDGPGTGATGSGEDGPFAVAGSDKVFVLDWTTTSHTGVPTPVTAEGPGSEQLAGSYPNTHLHEVLRAALTS
jgi:alkaline phosphatase